MMTRRSARWTIGLRLGKHRADGSAACDALTTIPDRSVQARQFGATTDWKQKNMPKRMPRGHKQMIAVCHLLVRTLPLRVASDFMAGLFRRHGDKFLKMENIRKNLRETFPQLNKAERERLAVDIAANFGRHIAELSHVPNFRRGTQAASIELAPVHGAKINLRRPAIFVGAHLGSWELMPLAFERHRHPLTCMYSANKNSAIDNAIQSMRRKIGVGYAENPTTAPWWGYC